MTDVLIQWALPRIERLLPLDQTSLKQILEYANTQSKDAAADHLKNLLGDSSQALDFITTYNSRRKDASAAKSATTSRTVDTQQAAIPDNVPAAGPRQQKKKANIHSLPARQVQDHGNTAGAYVKKNEDDYMSKSARVKPSSGAPSGSMAALPEIAPAPPRQGLQTAAPTLEEPARNTTATPMISGLPERVVPSSKTSRTSSPAPKTKISITGGKAMSGASSTLSDLDSAIRSLELQTNPLLSGGSTEDTSSRTCFCMATQHPLLSFAPNCMSCGQIICLKQGLGPCVSCSAPLMTPTDLQAVLRILKDERGKERQAEGNKAHKRAEVAAKPRAFTGRDFLSATKSTTASPLSSLGPTPNGSRPTTPDPPPSSTSATAIPSVPANLASAQAHRDKLLSYQAHNAQRTHIHDEAADYTLPTLSADGSSMRGGNIWATPAERAMQLKRQQKAMREMEFNARPEWERRKVVAEIDLSGRKVVRRVVRDKFEDAPEQDGDGDGIVDVHAAHQGSSDAHDNASSGTRSGAFGKNPLLGKLIRPVLRVERENLSGAGGAEDDALGTAAGKVKQAAASGQERNRWRRIVQDDRDENEDVILDGGTRGFSGEGVAVGVGVEV